MSRNVLLFFLETTFFACRCVA
uniref:Uncharacterized protein n=1 Tax=Leersia perrieri TaxID=77586 RepID=A0A0D9WQ39_9ORYZ